MKYASLLADAALTIDWRHPNDYWAFALVTYPFLDEEDFDIVQMNFTSFTEGRISAYSVLEYQLFGLLKGTELRYQQFYEQLHELGSGSPSFSEEEFMKAVRDLLPKGSTDPKKAKALYDEAYESALFWSNLSKEKTSDTQEPPIINDVVVHFDNAISTEKVARKSHLP